MYTKNYTENKNEKRPLFLSETVEEHRQERLRIVAERIVAVAKTPIIEKRSFKKGISFQDFVCRNIGTENAVLLTFGYDFAQKFEVGSVVVKQMLFACGDKLCGVHSRKQIKRNAVFYHEKQLSVEVDEGLKCIAVKVDTAFESLIFIIKKIGKS